MQSLQLVIGNKNYSSWSLRTWLLMRHFDLDFEEIRIPLSRPDTREKLARHSPSLKVPVLKHGGRVVWESLAICEYVSEQLLDGRGWPVDAEQRALGRVISCEMHAGFNALRGQWPMNCRLRRQLPPSPEVQEDIDRVSAIWDGCLQAGDGQWLLGGFSIADCMFAPVALRFHSYQPRLSRSSQKYVETVLQHPAVREWMAAGREEAEVIKEDEVAWIRGEMD